jgi:CubicO group peptidase (beta-lactamase class C family)
MVPSGVFVSADRAIVSEPVAARFAAVDAIFDRLFERAIGPGILYGVVIDGELAHVRGMGTTRVGAAALPDRSSVFRIASMTKSFTAAAILLLRDEARLRLDDPVAAWVPDLAGLHGPTADAPPITIEHLLTMSAGFPTDDPWGDRQQGLELDRFAAFLRDRPSLAWAPGTRFDYSNLGYGILGRVVTAAGGREYREFVQERLLQPLGMMATTYLPEKVPEGRRASGYLRRDDAWLDEPSDPYGALAAMGGVLTSIEDLARWVAGFIDAFPARDDPASPHPLSRATRREMQQVHRSIPPQLSWSAADPTPKLEGGGYGYGLFVLDDLRLGRTVGHGGGYPGFGSHMRWHPASGIGVIAFANARYAQMGVPVVAALAELVENESGRVRRVAPWPATSAARAVVERLIARWDDGAADGLFAMNVELDEPIARRREAIERVRAVHGQLRPDASEPEHSESAAHLVWWMRGERGRVKVELLLDPERPPRVQALKLTSVPEPPAGLTAIAERLAGLLGEPGPVWPDALPLAASADRAAIERGLRAAEARFGPVVLGQPVAGDGATTASWALRGERVELQLRVELDEPDGAIVDASFIPRTLRGLDEAP